MILFLSIIILWIISLTLHEYGHARMAYAGGDHTVADKGYLSMNPLRYIHPVMSIIVPIIILMIGGIPLPGGAVYIEMHRLRSRHWCSAVSAAGPAANVILLLLTAIPFAMGLHLDPELSESVLFPTLAFFGYLMALSTLLNLLPLPGLDGFGIIEPYLPHEWQRVAREFSQYTMLLFIAVIVAAPGALKFLFYGSDLICEGLGIPQGLIYLGQLEFHSVVRG